LFLKVFLGVAFMALAKAIKNNSIKSQQHHSKGMTMSTTHLIKIPSVLTDTQTLALKVQLKGDTDILETKPL
jgi:hypothetical protein